MRNTYLRFIQLVSGVVIAVLLGIHMLILHLDVTLGFFGAAVTETTSWQSMVERAGRGIWVGLYIALLAFGLYHALIGLRGVIFELTPSARTERVVTRAIIAFGIIAFIGGTYVPVVLLAG